MVKNGIWSYNPKPVPVNTEIVPKDLSDDNWLQTL